MESLADELKFETWDLKAVPSLIQGSALHLYFVVPQAVQESAMPYVQLTKS